MTLLSFLSAPVRFVRLHLALLLSALSVALLGALEAAVAALHPFARQHYAAYVAVCALTTIPLYTLAHLREGFQRLWRHLLSLREELEAADLLLSKREWLFVTEDTRQK